MTNEEWVEYYLKHPKDLLGFIETVNEYVEKTLEKVNDEKQN